jgi:hypothetical protein
MRPDDLRRILRAQPFQPFRLHVHETTVYEIRHPEQAMVGLSTVTLNLPSSSHSPHLGEQEVIIALLHITHQDHPALANWAVERELRRQAKRRSRMQKLALFPVLLVAGCLVSGLYGALHNQISYTVSPDYFHAFKFHQFGIPEGLRGRFGASIVGWQASWWMGLLIGVPVLLVGLILPGWKAYLSRCLIAFAVVVGTALAVGLAALVYANCTITEASLPRYWYPEGVSDYAAFARAGTMHNFSYLGGFIGIITGSLYLIGVRARLTRRCN